MNELLKKDDTHLLSNTERKNALYFGPITHNDTDARLCGSRR